MMQMRTFLLIVLSAALIAPPASAEGGGTVVNNDPTVTSFAILSGSSPAAGGETVFTAFVRDPNGEEDIVELRLQTETGPAITSLHTLTAEERGAVAEPATFTLGWKVWDPTPGDGTLNVQARITYATSGLHEWRFGARDEGDWVPSAALLSVRVATRSGGGGGGGGGGDPPSSTGVPPSNDQTPSTEAPSVDPDPDGDGIPTDVETRLGTDATDASSRPSFDISDGVHVDVVGENVVLSWDLVAAAEGYQVWRSNSPYGLIATIRDGTQFVDAGAPAGSKYKLTFFVGTEPELGYAVDLAELAEVSGWNETTAVVPEIARVHDEPGQTHPSSSPLFTGLLWVAGAFVAVTLIVVVGYARSLARQHAQAESEKPSAPKPKIVIVRPHVTAKTEPPAPVAPTPETVTIVPPLPTPRPIEKPAENLPQKKAELPVDVTLQTYIDQVDLDPAPSKIMQEAMEMWDNVDIQPAKSKVPSGRRNREDTPSLPGERPPPKRPSGP